MTIDEIIHAFSHVEKLKFPEEALHEAIKKKEEITPVLLEYLKKSPTEINRDYNEKKTENTGNFMWEFSILLLAQFREKSAFPHIVKLYTDDNQDMVETISGEFTTEKLPSVLASTFNGDLDALFDTIKNNSIGEFIRGSFIHASVILILHNILKLDDVRARYIELFTQGVADENITLLTHLNFKMADLAAPLLRTYIDDTLHKGLFYDTWYDMDDIDYCYNHPVTKDDTFYTMITDTYMETIDWVWFAGEEDFSLSDFDFLDNDDSILDLVDNYTPPPPAISQETFIRDAPKVGRNDPCPCGSGKKYKKCCLND